MPKSASEIAAILSPVILEAAQKKYCCVFYSEDKSLRKLHDAINLPEAIPLYIFAKLQEHYDNKPIPEEITTAIVEAAELQADVNEAMDRVYYNNNQSVGDFSYRDMQAGAFNLSEDQAYEQVARRYLSECKTEFDRLAAKQSRPSLAADR